MLTFNTWSCDYVVGIHEKPYIHQKEVFIHHNKNLSKVKFWVSVHFNSNSDRYASGEARWMSQWL